MAETDVECVGCGDELDDDMVLCENDECFAPLCEDCYENGDGFCPTCEVSINREDPV